MKRFLLTAAFYQKPHDAAPLRSSYDEYITYDKNGNIQHLDRFGDNDDAFTVIQIDRLEYKYSETDKNRLLKVIDAETNPSGFNDGNVGETDDFEYDDFGNMTVDLNKNITEIKYNHLNLPTYIEFGNNPGRSIS